MSAWQEIRNLHRQTTAGAKEGLAFRYVSRPAASAILWLIKDTRITPNQVTLASFAVALLGVGLLAIWSSFWALPIAALTFVLAHILDALDGQLARHRKQGSDLGHQLDFFIDELKAYAILLGLGIRAGFHMDAPGTGTMGLWPGDLATPTALLEPLLAYGITPTTLLITGTFGLGIGLSCTRFLRLPAWKEATAPQAESGEDTAPAATGLVTRIENAGRFIVDYPSWLPVLMLINRTDLYLLLYPATLALYALRSLAQIFLRAWSIQPTPR